MAVAPEAPRDPPDAGVDLRLLDPERQRTFLLLYSLPWLSGIVSPSVRK